MAELKCAYVWDANVENDGSKTGTLLSLLSVGASIYSAVKGIDQRCGRPAEYIIDGTALCDEHAREAQRR